MENQVRIRTSVEEEGQYHDYEGGQEIMPDSRPVEDALRALQAEAAQQSITLDPSFMVELRNYSRHETVKDLDKRTLENVIRELGRRALKRIEGKRAGGGHVRQATFELCDDPFDDCSKAARRILADQAASPAATLEADAASHFEKG